MNFFFDGDDDDDTPGTEAGDYDLPDDIGTQIGENHQNPAV